MTVRDALTDASTHIARRDAETLLLHLLDRDRPWLLAHPEAELTPAQAEAFRALALRRAASEPAATPYRHAGVLYGLPLRVTRDTLIPRPETELLVEAVLDWAPGRPRPLRILDVGTGTGAIALALAAHLPTAEVSACDLSPAALAVARQNAASLDLGDRVRFVESDVLSAFLNEPPFDAIVSNPPYVPTTDAATLQPEVVGHEPHLALFAGEDGLAIYRRLIPQAHAALRVGGLLALEFGFGQRDTLHALLQGWSDIRFLDDYAGIPRVALATRS